MLSFLGHVWWLLLLAVPFLGGSTVILRQRRRLTRRWLRGMLLVGSLVALLLGTALLAVGGYSLWFTHRPLPASVQRTLFEGVDYLRIVRETPARNVIHVVRINLHAPGIRFLVTPGVSPEDAPPFFRAMKTTEFLQQYRLQLAINGDFFYPFHSTTPFNFYPRRGDRVYTTGISMSEGKVYSPGNNAHPTLYISKDNRVSIDTPVGDAYNAISGDALLLKGGVITPQSMTSDRYRTEPQPRLAVGYTRDASTLIVVMVDGRQPNFSEGLSMPDFGRLALEYGLYDAINLDGGGSVTLAIAGADGQPEILNTPIDNYLPGRERIVANHLGVYAAPVRR